MIKFVLVVQALTAQWQFTGYVHVVTLPPSVTAEACQMLSTRNDKWAEDARKAGVKNAAIGMQSCRAINADFAKSLGGHL